MKKKVVSLVSLALVAVLVGCIFAACGKKDEAPQTDLDYIKQQGKLVICVTDYEPMNYKDENGKWIGFDTEYAEAVAKELGVTAEFVVTDWDNKYNEMESKAVDCAWNGLTISDEVKLNASVTKAYARNAQVVVMAKDKLENFKTVESMKDLQFAVENGSAGQAEAEANGFTKVTAVVDQATALAEVKSGAADACIIDLTMANAVTGEGKSYENYGVALELSEEQFGIACRKGSNLPAEIDRITEQLKADGTLQKLAEKYNVVLA